jgi:FkbM family methyltransferase
VLILRNIGRLLGVNKIIGSFINSDYYEERFSKEMIKRIKENDIIWDVGANIGLYTDKFLSRVGATGKVFAFEPVPASVDVLKNKFKDSENVSIMDFALGEIDGEIDMMFDDEPTSVTNKVVISGADGEDIHKVKIRTGNSIIESKDCTFPNVIKIDVEGHELSVLKGLSILLPDDRLRCIGVEVHFGILKDRGEVSAPREIEKILKNFGYLIKWTDPSHLVAFRF